MERPQVTRQTVERIVAAEDLIELRDLLGEGQVTLSAHEFLQPEQTAAKPRFLGLAPDFEVTLAIERAEVSEAQEVPSGHPHYGGSRPPDRRRGIGGHDLANDEPVEEHPDGG